MRDRLDRGKRVDSGEWVEGEIYSGVRSQNGQKWIRLMDGNYIGTTIAVIPKTVGEWTGKTDKNNIKAFEWDKFWDDDYEQEFTIVWSEGDLAWMAINDEGCCEFLSDIWDEKCEIIGSIHDNSESLNR